MRPVLYMLVAYAWLVQATWFLLELALVSFNDYQLANGASAIQTALNASAQDFIYRTLATTGATLIVLWADRHPLYKGASFGAFVATTVITFSWLATSLAFAYSMFATTQAGSLWNTFRSGGIFACTLGAAIMSVCEFSACALLWAYTLYQNFRATSTVKLQAHEGLLHALVWLGLLAYITWTAAAVDLTINLNYQAVTADLLGFWNFPALHGLVAFALTAAAVSSLGADQAWRTGSFFLNTAMFVSLFFGGVYMARTEVFGGVPSQCLDFGNGTCLAQDAVTGGFLGVACVGLLIHLVSIPLVFTRTAPEYATGVKTASADPYATSNGAYGAPLAGEQPAYIHDEHAYQPSVTQA